MPSVTPRAATPTLDPQAFLRAELEEHRQTFEATAASATIREAFATSLELLARAVEARGKVLLFGNGGSAADAQHLAAELVIRYHAERAPIAAVALNTDVSALTACGNDFGFEALFERQVEALGRPPDVVIALSTSGNSANVLRGLRQARAMGLATLGLTGGSGGQMLPLCDAVLRVPSSVTARIQEMHITLGHALCKGLEQRLGLL